MILTKRIHKRDHKSDRKSDHKSERKSDHKSEKKIEKIEKKEKSKEKLQKIEAKVNDHALKSLKSDKFTAFDMFAPKKPKVVPKPFVKPSSTPKALPHSPKVFSSPKAPTSPSVTSPKSSGIFAFSRKKKHRHFL